MPLTVYHLKTCDTCRKAIKALGEKHALDLIDVRADGVAEENYDWVESRRSGRVGLNPKFQKRFWLSL